MDVAFDDPETVELQLKNAVPSSAPRGHTNASSVALGMRKQQPSPGGEHARRSIDNGTTGDRDANSVTANGFGGGTAGGVPLSARPGSGEKERRVSSSSSSNRRDERYDGRVGGDMAEGRGGAGGGSEGGVANGNGRLVGRESGAAVNGRGQGSGTRKTEVDGGEGGGGVEGGGGGGAIVATAPAQSIEVKRGGGKGGGR